MRIMIDANAAVLDNMKRTLSMVSEVRTMCMDMQKMIKAQSGTLEPRPSLTVRKKFTAPSTVEDSTGTINDEKEIEKIILDKIKPHTDFYADDIADEFGLDLWATMNVLKSLEERGVVNG